MTRPREAARAGAISERGIRRARLAGAALLILGLVIQGLVILGLGALWASPALAQLCPRPGQAPKVTVTAKPGTLRLDRSLGDKELKALVQKLERNMHLTRGQPLGLTVGSISARYRTAIRYKKQQHGGYCVWLSHAEVSVGFEALTVYLDRAYEEGSDSLLAGGTDRGSTWIRSPDLDPVDQQFNLALRQLAIRRHLQFVAVVANRFDQQTGVCLSRYDGLAKVATLHPAGLAVEQQVAADVFGLF